MDNILNFLKGLPDVILYIAIGFFAFLENIFPPAPGDMVMAFGAFLVGKGRLNVFIVLIVTTIGSLMGFIVLFRLGRYLGKRFFFERDFFFFKKEDIIRAGKWFKKYGYFIIALNRFFPGVRSVISIAAGIYKLETVKVFILALLSCSLWNIIWISIGYTLGSNWDAVEENISGIFARYNMVIFALFLVLFVYIIIKRDRKE